jgi:hypothetical protein
MAGKILTHLCMYIFGAKFNTVNFVQNKI